MITSRRFPKILLLSFSFVQMIYLCACEKELEENQTIIPIYQVWASQQFRLCLVKLLFANIIQTCFCCRIVDFE